MPDLELEKYGLEEIPCNPTLTTSFGNGEYISLYPDQVQLPEDFARGLREIKYECGGVTLNLALDELPDFGFPEDRYNGFFGMTHGDLGLRGTFSTIPEHEQHHWAPLHIIVERGPGFFRRNADESG